jgi:hypothetical protein
MARALAATASGRLLSTLYTATEKLVRPVAIAETPGENREN